MTKINHLNTIVTTTGGDLKGGICSTESGVEYFEFLDIPYAKPPTGELRFKCPQPPLPWKGLRDATKTNLDHISCQYSLGKVKGSEDCLYLNVFVPKLCHHVKSYLPVMVYIHGGGFQDGSGTNKTESDPEFFIEKNVIIVSINYRLGVLGFLCLDIPEVAGNMGLKDQVQALRWVRDNIEAFGGDKNNVTIFGSSAGAAFVDYLILAPTAHGLFHKAIVQSGSSLNHWTFNHGMTSTIVKLLLDLGYAGTMNDNLAIYKFLRNTPVTTLTKSCKRIVRQSVSERLFFGFVPTVEKNFGDGTAIITKEPFQLFKEGNYNKVSVIRGFCNKEGYLTLGCKPEATTILLESETFFNIWPYKIQTKDLLHFNYALRDTYINNLSLTKDKDKIGTDFFGDFDVIAGLWLQSHIQAKDKVPVYMYEFSYDGNLNFVKYVHNIEKEGAAHADELGYLFKFPCTRTATQQDIAMRNTLITLWTNFASTGCPTPNDDFPVRWPEFSAIMPVYLNINTKMSVKSNYEPKRMAIFEEIYNKYNK